MGLTEHEVRPNPPPPTTTRTTQAGMLCTHGIVGIRLRPTGLEPVTFGV